MIYDITSLKQLQQFTKEMTNLIQQGSWVYLTGDLGTGKTAFCKYFIKEKGSSELVCSPTYAIMQDYKTATGNVIHCDLYRLAEAEELFEIGLFEMAEETNSINLIEWADKGKGVLPKANFTIEFSLTKDKRTAKLSKY